MARHLNKITKFLRVFALLFPGLLAPLFASHAGIIQSDTKKKDAYELHHNIIIYNKLSSFQNRREQNPPNIFDPAAFSTPQAATFSPEGFSSLTSHSVPPLTQGIIEPAGPAFTSLPGAGGVVGSFLDNFKDDPSLRTIYFTSKAITFGYQKKVANIMQLDFDMAQENYRQVEHTRDLGFAVEGPLTDQEAVAIKQETRFIFGFLSQAYFDILLVLATMVGGLYLCFRYVLGRYI
ncbi:hypothetical protein [Paremcibacter congregatus]|uniref:hypothetical protein n=1 Tax=Paremcibacter congregatus TaxID=2043170 RepID=UPI0030ED2602|tara:strand:- start:400 stop:1104 length:705 start_codon:yes stop_codon:yes gene_type:complete